MSDGNGKDDILPDMAAKIEATSRHTDQVDNDLAKLAREVRADVRELRDHVADMDVKLDQLKAMVSILVERALPS